MNVVRATIRTTLLIVFACTVAQSSGCARLRSEAAPPGWPQEWEGRRLARSNHAWVYAGTPRAGEDAAALCESAGSKFRALTGRALSPLVIIVLDKGESLPPLRTPLDDRVRGAIDKRAQRDESSRAALTSPQGQAAMAQMEAASLSLLEVSLSGDQRAELATLPQAVAEAGYPVLVVPTSRAMDAAADTLMRTGLEMSRMSLAARIASGPLVWWIRGKVTEALAESHRQSMMLAGQGVLDDAGRAALERYIRERADEFVALMPTDPAAAPPPGAGAPPETGPGVPRRILHRP